MQANHYRETLIAAVDKLVAIRHEIFDLGFGVAVAGELKEWSDTVPIGEAHTITREILEGCTDANMQMIVKLLGEVEETVISICNINKIEFPDQREDDDDNQA